MSLSFYFVINPYINADTCFFGRRTIKWFLAVYTATFCKQKGDVSMSGLKTILVDDDYLVLKDLRSMVDWESLGFSIIGTASTGKAALKLISEKAPSLVITDISMPAMDGFDLTEALLKDHPEIYIIFITSYADFDYAKKAIELGIRDYILKNEITPQLLTEKLARVRDRIRHTENTAQLNLRAEAARYFQDLPASLPEQLLHQSRFFYVISMQLPFEKLKAHFGRADKVTQELYDAASQTLLKEYPRMMLFTVDHLLIAGILPSEAPEGLPSTVGSRICRSITGSMQPLLSQKLLIFYAPSQMTLTAFRSLFEKAAHFVHYHSLLPGQDESLFSLTDADSFVPVNLAFRYDLLKNVPTDTEPFKEALEAYVSRLSNHKDADSLLMLYHNLVIQLEELSEHVVSPEEKIYLSSAEEFCSCFAELADDYQSSRKTHSDHSLSPVVNQAMQYIRENYGNHFLNIQMIADKLQISSGRLSVLFKQESGKTVNEYLTGVRISQSIYLLENTNLKIYEIADRVGYKSSQYFSQAFQQRTGMKPLDLRGKDRQRGAT